MALDTSLRASLASVLLALMAVAGAARAQEASPESAPRPAAIDCSPVLFRMLPGEFDFCLALKHWDKGDRKQAVELLELAAGWGNKSAQTALGVAYFNGDGVARDLALGLAWLALAAERRAPTASGLYLSARSRVDETEYARADGLYRQMRAKYADDVAAARADRHFRRQVRQLASNPVYGAGRCIVGLTYAFAGTDDQDTTLRSCSMASEHGALELLQGRYDDYFKGWQGRVTVGPAEPLKASGKP